MLPWPKRGGIIIKDISGTATFNTFTTAVHGSRQKIANVEEVFLLRVFNMNGSNMNGSPQGLDNGHTAFSKWRL